MTPGTGLLRGRVPKLNMLRIFNGMQAYRRLTATVRALSKRTRVTELTGAVFFGLLLGCSAGPMTITWQDTSENEQGFRIYRVTNQQKVIVAEVGPNVTQYTDTDAPRQACYIVTAFNATGESPPTNSTCR